MTDEELMQQALDALYCGECWGKASNAEPVAYVHLEEWLDDKLWPEDAFSSHPHEGMTPLYTAPPKREWQGLTDEEISEVLGSDIHSECSGELRFIRAIEAKLKEKNGY